MDEQNSASTRTFTEEIEIAGNQLIAKVKEILAEGNVRQIRIKARDGDVYLETPLTIGAVAGGVIVLAAPWLAVLGVLAALVSDVRIEVVREAADQSGSGEAKIEDGTDKNAA